MIAKRSTWIEYVVTIAVLGSIVGIIAYVAQTSYLTETISIPAIPLGVALFVYAIAKPVQMFLFKRAKALWFYLSVYLASSILGLVALIFLFWSKGAHKIPRDDLLQVIGYIHPSNYLFVIGPLIPAVLFIWFFERVTQSLIDMHSTEAET